MTDLKNHQPSFLLTQTISLVIFSALLILIVLTPIPYGTFQRWWDSAFEFIVFVLAALWMIEVFAARNFLTPDQRWLLAPLLALSIYALLQTIPAWPQTTPLGSAPQAISYDRYETQLVAIKLLALTAALALLLRCTDSSRRLSLLAHAVITIALASAVFGIVRQLYQYNAVGFLLPSLRKSAGYAQFINKNHFAFLAEMAFGLLIAFIAGRGIAWPRHLIYVALALPIWAALVLSNSRGGLVAMTSQIVFFVLVSDIGRARQDRSPAARAANIALKLALAVVLVTGIVIGMILVGGEPLADRLTAARSEMNTQPLDLSHADRASIWKTTLRLGYDHPIAGVGFGGYWIAFSRYHNASGELTPQQAHNDYLELWASGGLIGVAIFIGFAVIFSKQAYRRLHSADRFRRAVALGALTGLFGVAIHSLLDFGLHLTGNALACLVLITLATRQIDVEKPGSAGRHI